EDAADGAEWIAVRPAPRARRPPGAARDHHVDAARRRRRIDDEPHTVHRRIDADPRLGHRRVRTELQSAGRRLRREPRLHEPDAARARARMHALTPLARETVAAGRRLDGADALQARRARVGAREPGLAALLARVHAAVAALEQLHLVRA